MKDKAFQDFYSAPLAQCYGCGYANEHGLQIKSRWEDELSVCRYTPQAQHTAVPGFVYGGLIASLVDCHGTGTAAAVAYREAGRPMGSQPELRFVTGSLHVDFLKPTPLGPELVLKARPEEIKERKVVVAVELFVEGQLCARGRVVAVLAPASMIPEG